MRKAYIISSAIFLIICIAFAPMLYTKLLVPEKPRKDTSFSGVVKLWAVDGYHSGAMAWVSSNVAAFERKNSGVYIHITRMSEEILAMRLGRGERPDLILFPTGAPLPREILLPLDAADAEITETIKEEYLRSAESGSEFLAMPVMAGGYALLVSTERVPSLPPANWGELIDSLYVKSRQIKNTKYALACAGPTQRAAPLALVSLIGAESTHGIAGRRGGTLSSQFAKSDWDAALSSFVAGQSAVLVGTQREIRRLESLDTGGLNISAYVPEGDAFTDQVTYIGMINNANMDEARLETCQRFLSQLISENAQQTLSEYGVFSARSDISLYDKETQPMLSDIERSLEHGMLVPNTFAWAETRADFAARCEKFLLGESEQNPLLYLP